MYENIKTKLFTISFLVLVGFSFVSGEFVYAEEEYSYSMDELILSATGYFDANVAIKLPGETKAFSKILSIQLDNVPELPGDVAVAPSFEKKDSKEDYSAMDILGSKNYLVKNYTRDLELASKSLTDAFDLVTYYEISVDNLKTLDTSSNSKITVYFANDTSVNYLNATSVDIIDALYTRQFDYHQDLIYCSPDMDANVSVVRVTLTNIACDGFYVYSHSGGHHYVDTRNMGYWINNYDAEISAQGEDSISPQISSEFKFDDSALIVAIVENKNLLLEILEQFNKSSSTRSKESWLKTLLNEISTDQLRQCNNVDELRELFKYDVQKMYVYDLIHFLQKLNLLFYEKSNENIYWRNKDD